MSNFWDQRYAVDEYVYGTEPSIYFKQVINNLKPGKLLVPGAGEGRDAVYAASLGWEVHAFDQSSEGQRKALMLAETNNVNIKYETLNADDFTCTGQKYDLIAIVFMHFESNLRMHFHNELVKCLTPGGLLLVEAFHKNQIANNSGGPKNPDMLVTSEILAADFNKLSILENKEIQINFTKGSHHSGLAEVVRFLGMKT